MDIYKRKSTLISFTIRLLIDLFHAAIDVKVLGERETRTTQEHYKLVRINESLQNSEAIRIISISLHLDKSFIQ